MASAQNPEAAIADEIRGRAKAEGIALETIWSQIGLSQRTATRYMAGHTGKPTFSIQDLIGIASILGITLSELLPNEVMQDAA